MTHISRIPTVVVLALTLFAACTSTKEQIDASPGAQITVQNDNVLDMTVYALRGTERIRLGMITSGNKKVFTLKHHVVVNTPVIRFIADPVGSARSILIDELPVFPGNEIVLWIPSRRLWMDDRFSTTPSRITKTPLF